ncbi:MAG: GGDEF domain-containing response regulator [Pseudomonadales bacterium]|uniref:cyclic-guanylate-specific phosphodiesterase n=1 Tax=Oleiphilus messinensis TaxID=141451 RepID=A0A1Y0I425_9GAMM|nr:GGDEF domain-containing response regulator [Oleiphilus messinensis]ARU54214.1 signal transduction diguanylate cyclase/phosphodiesterase [Oleiphilus messinensis]MCG8609973.1 GGDEF domain-containing response regulator [Pseudomonadales bacterium]
MKTNAKLTDALGDDYPPPRILILARQLSEYLWIKHLLNPVEDGYGLELQWCHDFSVSQHYLENSPFDLIIWDCRVDGGDPLTYLSFLTVESGNKPVICLAGQQSAQAVHSYFLAGADEVLEKHSLTSAVLSTAIRSVLFRHNAEEQTLQRRHTDSLTGVVSRTLFFDRLNHALHRADRNRELLAVMVLNIDGFTAINETMGYKAGDQLIRLASSRIKRTIRRSDSLARIGGDEFAIILDRLDNYMSCRNVADKLMELFQMPFAVNHETVTVSASIGIACYPDSGKSADELVKYANRAMVAAKDDIGNSSKYYNQDLNETLMKSLDLEADFRRAIRNQELRLFYQPRIDISNNELVGMESLVRWQHPTRGLLNPGQFIDLAERSGMIVPMGYWVIDQACRDLAHFQAMGYLDLTCAVNLSFRQFHDKKLSETVFRIIYNSGVNTSSLEFELTESAMMSDWEHTHKCLSELSKLGISFSLDDFGTGYSSFATLQKLPLSTLKIDQSFISQIEQDTDSRVIVKAMINLAHNLQMQVVAEGVENENQLSFLQFHDCDQVQGYYFGKPVPADQFVSDLRKYYPQSRLESFPRN